MLTGRNTGAGPWTAGLMMHLVLSGLIGLCTPGASRSSGARRRGRSGSWPGRSTVIAGLVVPMMDGMNRCVRDGKVEGFGAFGARRGGMMVVGFLVDHLLYGLVVGWLYAVPGGP
jgi:hypothetical protein